MNKGQRSRCHNEQKIRFQIKKMHAYVAYVVKPDWNMKELCTLICERLNNKQLAFILEVQGEYYKPMKEYAFAELTERQVLGKERIIEDPIKVDKNYRKTKPRF